MGATGNDHFGAASTLETSSGIYTYYRLAALSEAGIGHIERLPYAIKVLLEMGDTLSGRLLIYDALAMAFTELKVRRDPECPACGPNANLEFKDYEAWCAGGTQALAHAGAVSA